MCEEKKSSGFGKFMCRLLEACGICFIVFVIIPIVGMVFLCKGCIENLDSMTEDFSSITDDQLTLEVIDEPENSSDGVIAVLDVKGIIGSTSSFGDDNLNSRDFLDLLDVLKDEENLKAIILDMDTPGGEVIASDEIYHGLLKFKEERNIPIITCMHSMGASGGYYIAAASDYIIANRLTFTGSIGVIMPSYNITGLLNKIGVTDEPVKSGDMKDIMSMSRPRTEKEQKYLQEMIDGSFQAFAEVVAAAREKYETWEDVRKSQFGDGRVLSGADAMRLGLVDELGYFEDAMRKARELGGDVNAAVIRYSSQEGLLDVLSSFLTNRMPMVRSLLPVKGVRVEAGKLYYLMPSAL